jgi:branched-chain amino acid transport system substrate-binding protein
MNKHILATTFSLFTLAGSHAWADHLVAIAGPMTGQYASAGDQIRKGAEMAIADINAKGGVGGQKLKLEIGDDACDPKQAVAVANQMVNKKILFMHGHWCSSSTIPASEVYAEANIPMVTVSTNPKVTDRGLKNIFAIAGRDDQQGQVAGAYLAEKFKGKKDCRGRRQERLRQGPGRRSGQGDGSQGRQAGVARVDHRRREGLLRPGQQAQGGRRSRSCRTAATTPKWR